MGRGSGPGGVLGHNGHGGDPRTEGAAQAGGASAGLLGLALLTLTPLVGLRGKARPCVKA